MNYGNRLEKCKEIFYNHTRKKEKVVMKISGDDTEMWRAESVD